MRGFIEGAGETVPPPSLIWRILQKIYEENNDMNVQMPFSDPLFPELGSRSLPPF